MNNLTIIRNGYMPSDLLTSFRKTMAPVIDTENYEIQIRTEDAYDNPKYIPLPKVLDWIDVRAIAEEVFDGCPAEFVFWPDTDKEDVLFEFTSAIEFEAFELLKNWAKEQGFEILTELF